MGLQEFLWRDWVLDILGSPALRPGGLSLEDIGNERAKQTHAQIQLLHKSPHLLKIIAQRDLSIAADRMHDHASLFASLGQEGVQIRGQHLTAKPIVQTTMTHAGGITSDVRTQTQVLGPQTQIRAPEGPITLDFSHTMNLTAVQTLAQTGTALSAPHLSLDAQTLTQIHAESRRIERNGFFGSGTTTTSTFAQQTHEVPCTFLDATGITLWGGNQITQRGPQFVAPEIITTTPHLVDQARQCLQVASHSHTQETTWKSRSENHERASSTPQPTHYRAQSVTFRGGDADLEAPAIEAKGDIVFEGPTCLRAVQRQVFQKDSTISTGFWKHAREDKGFQHLTCHNAQLQSPRVRFLMPAVLEVSARNGDLGDLLGAHPRALLEGSFGIVWRADQRTSWHEKQRSLGIGAQVLLGITMTAVTGGLCSLTVGGNVLAGSVRTAALASLATSFLGSGYAGRPLLDVRSLRAAAFAGITAGLTEGLCQATGFVTPANGAALTWGDRAHKAAAAVTSRTLMAGVRGEARLDRIRQDGAVGFAQSLVAQEIGEFHHGNPGIGTDSLSLAAHGGVGALGSRLMDEDPMAGAFGAVVGELSGMTLRDLGMGATWGVPLSQAFTVLARWCCALCLSFVVVMAVLAALNYGYQWFQHFRSLYMSRQEVKDEFKEQEGDPPCARF